MRKVLLIFLAGIFSLFFVAITILIIYSGKHQDTIEKSVVEYINSQFENAIHIEDFHLSYLNNFPNARIRLSNIVLTDDTTEVIRIGSIRVLFNIRNFLKDSIKIHKIIIDDAVINNKIDINGRKPVIRFSKDQSQNKHSGLPVHIFSPDLELNNLSLSLTNDYKYNETYVTIFESKFKLNLDKILLYWPGILMGDWIL